ncbi:ATP-binding protein [Echinicola jeungdonensis]|uniref:ATP-binding protein n=1 Tax=Echinicola jeungdonensis TaxID=709343 RepID=A0ABV5J375_9BACT|nr:ATP-binding protein [Echinicola jeungdonensis]MDN3668928.1 ATP-binding protein [Echinicola jeungdonensis]
MPEKVKKIVIIGPESTGKSTLTQTLARHFGEPWVEEYAREYIEKLDRPYRFEDLVEIAQGQIKLEEEKANQANQFLFCDTDLNVIKVWSEHKYQKLDPWVAEQLELRTYDLYLLTDIDLPWEDDPQREYPDPEMRKYFFDQFEALLSKTNVPVVKISGNWEERQRLALNAIKVFFNQ